MKHLEIESKWQKICTVGLSLLKYIFLAKAIRLQDKAKAMKFYDYVFENQKHISDEGFLKKAAAYVGANLKRIDLDIKSNQVKKTIEDDMNEFQSFGFTGTPVLILNGVALNGAQKLEELERVAQLTLKK